MMTVKELLEQIKDALPEDQVYVTTECCGCYTVLNGVQLETNVVELQGGNGRTD